MTAAASARETGKLSLAAHAFAAILRRDLVVTGREFVSFLPQPLFSLFIFGKVLPASGLAGQNFAPLMLPGIVALPLVLDLGFAREIDDRLLAPMPITMVALEKVLFASIRGIIAGAVIFPLAAWILGSGYAVRTGPYRGHGRGRRFTAGHVH